MIISFILIDKVEGALVFYAHPAIAIYIYHGKPCKHDGNIEIEP